MAKKSLYIRIAGTVATLGPIGQKLPAPGTFGALAGTLFYFLVFQITKLNTYEHGFWCLLAMVALVLVGIPICSAGEKLLEKRDPGEVNFDEFAVMPICFAGLGNVISSAGTLGQILWLAGGFAIFRFFDILKPLGIRKLQSFPRGFGVMVDDVAAAMATCGWLWAVHYAILYFSTGTIS